MATETTAIEVSRPQTALDIRAQVNLIQEVMQAVMKQDVHYGVIPGCQKPTLYKPGSEKLLSTFRIAIEPIVEDLSTEDVARYRVVTRATSAISGAYLGSGVGEASSDEEKYRWRSVVCQEEWEATPDNRRRLKWKKGKQSAYSVQQVRTEKADIANTILKMAKKRSQIDVTLTVTGASDCFAQDIEDLPEELRHEMSEEHTTTNGDVLPPQQPAAMPQRKSAAVAPPKPVPTPAPPAQPAAPAKRHVCPECGEELKSDHGCNFCGWMANPPAPPRQEPGRTFAGDDHFNPSGNIGTAARPEPAKVQVPPSQSARVPQGEKISEAQGKRFFAICMGNGITKPEMKQYLEQTWGISDTRDIVKGEMYETCCAWAQGR